MTGVELFAIGSTAFTIGDALMIGGALLGAAGQSQEADAEVEAAEYNAAVDLEQGRAEAERIRRQGKRDIARQKVNIGKSGATTEGSPLLALAESAKFVELDAQHALVGAEQSASLEQKKARSIRKAKPYNVGSTLLSSAARIGTRKI